MARSTQLDEGTARRILADCRYDPGAGRLYDIMRGGFVWKDELPPPGSRHHLVAFPTLARVIAYRASLTLGRPIADYEADWKTLQAVVPSWPGFREDRIHGAVERDLRAAKLKEERCLAEFESEMDWE